MLIRHVHRGQAPQGFQELAPRAFRRGAAIVLRAVTSKSLAKGGLEEHHRQHNEGISPEIDISWCRSSVRKSSSPTVRQAGHRYESHGAPAVIAVSMVG